MNEKEKESCLKGIQIILDDNAHYVYCKSVVIVDVATFDLMKKKIGMMDDMVSLFQKI